MAVTQLSDLVIVPKMFNQGVTLEALEKDLLIGSGAAVVDPALDAFLNGPMGGKTVEVRSLGPLAPVDANISTDLPTQAVPQKLGDVSTVAVRQSLNQAFSSMDLVADLYGSDPLGSVMGRLGKYWTTVRQNRVLASIQGILAASVDGEGNSDLIVDITGGDALPDASITAANFINSGPIIDAAALMGDRDQDLTGLAVHSVVYATMQKLNLITTEKLSDTNIFISRYMGFPILVDDGLTVERRVPTGSTPPPAYNVYYSYLFGYGAISLGNGTPLNPVKIERSELAGTGGGQETLVSRVEWIIHPNGYKCNLDATPTMAQLKAKESWTRAYERKRIKLAVIKSRG
jgi:hypothetical protein